MNVIRSSAVLFWLASLSCAGEIAATTGIISITNKPEICNDKSKIAIRTNGPGLGTLRLSLGYLSFAEKPQGQLALLKDNGEIVHAKRTKCEWRPWQIASEFAFPQGVAISQRTWVEAPFAHADVTITGEPNGAKLVIEGSTDHMGKAFVSPNGVVMIEEMDPSLKPCVMQIACTARPDRILLSADGKEWREKDFIWGEKPVAYRFVYDRPPRAMVISAHLGMTSDFLPAEEWDRSRRRANDVKNAWIHAYSDDLPDIECPDARVRDLVQLCFYVNRTSALQPGGRLPYAFGAPSKYMYPMWWMWDTAFHAVPAAWMRDPSFAFDNLLTHTLFQSRKGAIPDAGGLFYGDTGDGKWISPDFYDQFPNPSTGPCVTGIAVWDVYEKTGSVDFLKRMYPHLVMYERWLSKEKSAGIDPDLIAYTNWFDVGWDDSKRWGKGWEGNRKFADIDWGFPVVPVDANTFFMGLREALSRIADVLGEKDQARTYIEEANATGRAIDRFLWNDKKGYYFDILPSGRMLDVWTPAGLVPLMTHVPSAEKYRRMREHLLDPKLFWTKYPLPTINLDDETASMVMWCGPTWLNVNWQVLLGLFDYDADTASKLLWSTIDMMTPGGRPVCWEHYDSRTGQGLGGHDYGWSTLVIDMILRHLFGINPTGDLVAFNPHLPAKWPDAHVRNVFVLGTSLDLRYSQSGNVLKIVVKNNGAKEIAIEYGGNRIALRPDAVATVEVTHNK